MAEDLMTPAPVDGASVMDAGFGEDFEGFGNSSCSDHVEDLSPQELPQERPIWLGRWIADPRALFRPD